MVAQVVDSSNLVEYTQTGKVPAFKPPGEAPVAATGNQPQSSQPGTKQDETTQPRGAGGKFTSAKEGDTTTPASPKAPATGADDDEAGLSEVVRQKIGAKHRQMKEAEERERRETLRAIRAEGEAAELKRKLAESEQKSRPAQVNAPPKEPKPEDFTTVQEYTDALVTFRVDQRLREEKDRQQAEEVQRENEAREREFNQRLTATREKHADFDDVLRSIHGTDLERIHADVIEYIKESNNGGDLLYHLAKNPDVLDRLRKLSPRKAVAELGKLETKWDNQPETVVKGEQTPTLTQVANPAAAPVSKAPAPIAPLSTAGIAPVAKKPEDMSVTELREFRRQEKLLKRG